MSCDEEERGGIPGLHADLSLRRRARDRTTPHIKPRVYWRHVGALNLLPTPQNENVTDEKAEAKKIS